MISVVIPVYNEKDCLEELGDRLIRSLDRMNRPWEVIFANDGSRDGSEEVLDRLAQEDERFKVVHFRRNFGQTAAMMAGFDLARGEIVVTMDADLQNEPEDIPKVVSKLEEGYDLCSGWRSSRNDPSITRVWPSKVANWLISKVTGVRLHDYGCSLKAYRREVLSGVHLHGEMHRFIPIYVSLYGARVCEIPVNHKPRGTGTSSYGLERIFKVALDLLVVKFLYHYGRKPIYFFGGFAALCFAFGGVMGLWALYLKFFEETNLNRTPLPDFTILGLVSGLICVLMGLLAEIIMRTYHETQGLSPYAVKATRNIENPPG